MRKEGEVCSIKLMCADGGGEHCKLELHGYLGDEGVDKVYSCHLTPNSS